MISTVHYLTTLGTGSLVRCVCMYVCMYVLPCIRPSVSLSLYVEGEYTLVGTYSLGVSRNVRERWQTRCAAIVPTS